MIRSNHSFIKLRKITKRWNSIAWFHLMLLCEIWNGRIIGLNETQKCKTFGYWVFRYKNPKLGTKCMLSFQKCSSDYYAAFCDSMDDWIPWQWPSYNVHVWTYCQLDLPQILPETQQWNKRWFGRQLHICKVHLSFLPSTSYTTLQSYFSTWFFPLAFLKFLPKCATTSNGNCWQQCSQTSCQSQDMQEDCQASQCLCPFWSNCFPVWAGSTWHGTKKVRKQFYLPFLFAFCFCSHSRHLIFTDKRHLGLWMKDWERWKHPRWQSHLFQA